MQSNWYIIILGFAAIIAIIAFLVKQDQKDEEAEMKDSKERDEILIGEEHDNK
jgi:uncharacterized membrane protein YuzA (DUF378 family)